MSRSRIRGGEKSPIRGGEKARLGAPLVGEAEARGDIRRGEFPLGEVQREGQRVQRELRLRLAWAWMDR